MKPKAIAEVVTTFRKLGFFCDDERTPLQLARDLAQRADDWWGPLSDFDADADDPRCFSDLAVLRHDASRVWRLESWEILFDRKRTLAEGYAYCRDYGEVMTHLSVLSAHAFRLSGEAATGGRITALLNGKSCPIRFRRDGKVLSTDFLAKVNEAIQSSGHEFVLVSNRFCCGFILLLSTDTKNRLRVERGWEYARW